VGNLSGVLGSSINDLESIYPANFSKVAVQFLSESRNSILTLLLKNDAGEPSASKYNHSVQLEISSIIRTSWGSLTAIGVCKKMSLHFALTTHIMQSLF